MTLLSNSVIVGDHFRHGTYNDLRHDIIEGGEGVYAYNPVITRYLMISPSSFRPERALGPVDWGINQSRAQNAVVGGALGLRSGLRLPHGAIVTQMTAYMYRLSGAQDVAIGLIRTNPIDSTWVQMASILSTNTGNHSQSDSSIAQATIDNSAYTYALTCQLNTGTGGAVDSARLYAIKITYTITVPFP